MSHTGAGESGITDQTLLFKVCVDNFAQHLSGTVMHSCPGCLWCTLWGGTSWILGFPSVFYLLARSLTSASLLSFFFFLRSIEYISYPCTPHRSTGVLSKLYADYSAQRSNYEILSHDSRDGGIPCWLSNTAFLNLRAKGIL